MNMNTSAHKKYTLQIGLQRLFRTFSYVPCFKRKEAVGEEGNEFSLFSVICKNKFIYTINGKSENNTKSLKIDFGECVVEATRINIFNFVLFLFSDFLFQILRFQLSRTFRPSDRLL